MDKISSIPHDLQIVYRMESLCKALGDATRLKIIKILASHKDYRPCVNDLAKNLNITQPAASQHLKILKNVGLITSKREGYRVFHSINIETMRECKNIFNTMEKLAFEQCEEFDKKHGIK